MNEGLYEDLEIAEEMLGEIETQFKSECALYGDAWPDAQNQVARCLATVNGLRKKLGMPATTSNCSAYVR